MRNTLIIGLLLCLPAAVLLASASLVVLAGNPLLIGTASFTPKLGYILPPGSGASRFPLTWHPTFSHATVGSPRSCL